MLTGLSKFSGRKVRQRASSPKLQVLNTALMTSASPLGFDEARADRAFWGRLVESAVGAHLSNGLDGTSVELLYWRERNHEVDFVLRAGKTVTAIEVKSGMRKETLPGLDAFARIFRPRRILLVGAGGIPLEEFLLKPPKRWVEE